MRNRIILLVALVLLTAVIFPVSAASAMGSYGVNTDSEAYKKPTNNYDYPGECVWYCWGRAYEKLGIRLPWRHNANQWDDLAGNNNYLVDKNPSANSIAVWDSTGGVGHVAFVEDYDNETLHLSEYNFRKNHSGKQIYTERDQNIKSGYFNITYASDSYPKSQTGTWNVPDHYIHLITEKGSLDVNFNVDGNDTLNLDGIGYIEVYVNGRKKDWKGSTSYTDFSRNDLAVGSYYDVRVYITNPDYWCAGVAEGNQYGYLKKETAVRFDIRTLASGAPSRVLPDGDYIITTAANPDKKVFYYLDIPGQNYPAGNNENVDIHGPKDEDLQQFDTWSIRYENGFYTIKQNGTNMSLSVADDSHASAANVVVRSDDPNNSAQRWAITHDISSGYRIRAKHTGMSLEISGGTVAAGTNVAQYPGHSGSGQAWLFIPYQPEQTLQNGKYLIFSGANDAAMLGVSADSIQDKTPIQLVEGSVYNSKNVFDIQKLDNGYYLITHEASGMAVEVYGGVSVSEAVSLHTGNGSIAQQWAITGRNGKYGLRVRSSGYALDLETNLFSGGLLTVKQKPWRNFPTQVWDLVPAEHTVTYRMTDSGDPIPGQVKYYKTDLVLRDTVPVREGFTFLGWAANPDATEPVVHPGDIYSKDEDLTLYPVWQSAGHRITYQGAETDRNIPESQTFSGSVTISGMIPLRDGYEFSHWETPMKYENGRFTGSVKYYPGDVYSGDEDLTLHAVWKGKTYTLYFDANGGECDVVSMPIENGAMFYPNLPAPIRRGYRFTGWLTKEGTPLYKIQDAHVRIDEDKYLHATWAELKKTVLPEKLTKIEDEAFFGSDVEYVEIPPTVTSIGSKAFGNCNRLVNVIIHRSTTEIAPDAFSAMFVSTQNRLTIYCEENSAAHNLAKEKEIQFVLIDSTEE